MMASRKVRILLADDNQAIRETMSEVINAEPDLEVVWAAADGPEAVAQARALNPDLALIDISMPGGGARETIPRLREALPGINILAMAVGSSDQDVLQLFRLGARGYIAKSIRIEDVLKAVRAVGAGEVVMPARIQALMVRELKQLPAPELDLAPEEYRALGLLTVSPDNPEFLPHVVVDESAVQQVLRWGVATLQARDRASPAAPGAGVSVD